MQLHSEIFHPILNRLAQVSQNNSNLEVVKRSIFAIDFQLLKLIQFYNCQEKVNSHQRIQTLFSTRWSHGTILVESRIE